MWLVVGVVFVCLCWLWFVVCVVCVCLFVGVL